MRFYLWDTDVAKLLGAYRTEDEALSQVHTLVARYGEAYAEDLALGVELDDGSAGSPVSGAELLLRAEVALSDRAASGLRASRSSTTIVDAQAARSVQASPPDRKRSGED